MLISRLTYSAVMAGLIILEIINERLWQNPLVGILLFVLALAFLGLVTGARVFKNWSRLEQIIWGSFVVLCLMTVFLTACYYLWSLGPAAFWLSWLVPVLIAFFLCPTPIQVQEKEKNKFFKQTALFVLFLLVLTLFYFAFYILWQSGTTEAIRSPWVVVPGSFFIIIFTIAAASLAWLSQSKSEKASLLLIGANSFLFLSVALFVYKLGFGFDPFIHQATEKYIAQFGTITPKPFYYIGQYSLVNLIHYFSYLGIGLIDKILLPALTAIYLPPAVIIGLRNGLKIKPWLARIGALALFAITFSTQIATTPQGLANLLALIIIFLSLAYLKEREPRLWVLMLFGALALAIHPLSGIPLAVYLLILLILKIKTKILRIVLAAVTSVVGAVSLPLVFILNSVFSKTTLEVTSSILTSPRILISNLKLPDLFTESHFSSLLDFAYIYGSNLVWLVPLIALLAIIFIAKKILPHWWLPLAMFAVLMVNYFFLQNAVEFSFLISYEQGDYAQRILNLAQFFLYPFFLTALLWWLGRAWRGPWSFRIIMILFLAGCLASSLYLSYPRHDALEISKGINVSQTDIAAVQWVERDSPDDNFIVLANQTVSAAALHEFGFKKYYGDIFYYPIPTGGELYQYYLDMSYESPARTTAAAAMNLAGVDYAYFIINDYWWNAEKIIEDAKLQADSWQMIDDGKIYIFKYLK